MNKVATSVVLGVVALTGMVVISSTAPAGPPPRYKPVPTTVDDFFQPGTQPLGGNGGDPFADVVSATSCTFCHAEYLADDNYDEPWDAWVTSMMAQSTRDPVWRAALAIANQDATNSGEYCIRCHAPGAWLNGRSDPGDLSEFIDDGIIDDFDGVTCHYCHRAVSPTLEPDSPVEDAAILAALEFPPGDGRGNGRHVTDPADVRRGPFDDVPQNLHGVPIIYSPWHRRSEVCATCHDLGNPVFMKQPDGTFVLADSRNDHGLGMPHPTQNPHDMFPEQRTYSEWLNSQFADGGVLFDDGRFGGNHPTGVMEECQDCHMPDQFAGGCFAWEFEGWFARPDMPQHSFNGANTWVLRAVRALYPDSETNLNMNSVDAAHSRTVDMLRAASDLQVGQFGPEITTRVINYSGHKLPTGMPEGRRMWVNVQFLDGQDQLIAERGAYDLVEATLEESDTKVYRMKLGIDQNLADQLGRPAGETQSIVLANQILEDNRIPPIGFTNAAFEAVGAAPTSKYDDGQYWDDTSYDIPPGAAKALVTVYYQSMTREFIEHLRDANFTTDDGDIVYGLWEDPLVGNKAPPVDMDMVMIDLGPPVVGDVDADGDVDFADILAVLSAWGPCPPPDLCLTDLDGNGQTSFGDLLIVLSAWTG